MTVNGGNDALVWLFITMAVFWLLIWSAVRVATDRFPTPGRIAFIARTQQRGEGLLLTVQNKGTHAAVNFTVRWQGTSDGDPLLSTLLLAPDEEIAGLIAPPVDPAELKAGVIVVRYMNARGIYRDEPLAVLAPPSAPAPAIIAPVSAGGVAANQ